MIRDVETLGVRERIEAVIKMHLTANPGTPISVANTCKLASVSRANLYEHHRDLIQRIQTLSGQGSRRRPAATTTVSDLRRRLKKEEARSNALYYLCAELQAEVRRLRALVAPEATSDSITTHRRLRRKVPQGSQ